MKDQNMVEIVWVGLDLSSLSRTYSKRESRPSSHLSHTVAFCHLWLLKGKTTRIWFEVWTGGRVTWIAFTSSNVVLDCNALDVWSKPGTSYQMIKWTHMCFYKLLLRDPCSEQAFISIGGVLLFTYDVGVNRDVVYNFILLCSCQLTERRSKKMT